MCAIRKRRQREAQGACHDLSGNYTEPLAATPLAPPPRTYDERRRPQQMEIINTALANEPKRRRKSRGKGVRGRRGARGWGSKSDHKRKVLGQWGSGVANAIKAKEAQAERTKVGNKWRRQLESS